jgi:hypothetical protein
MPILINNTNKILYSKGDEKTESRSDYVYPYQYSGVSLLGSSENDPVWLIKRINFTTFNSPVIQQATGSWTNRYSLTYT